MPNVPGFQKQVNLQVFEGYPGDLASSRTVLTAASRGLFAKGAVIIGNAAFLCVSGNQMASNSTDAGSTYVAGFVLRNVASAPMPWADTAVGYSMLVPDGKQGTAAYGGDFLGIITGVQTNGTANHVPVLGEPVWVKLTDGSLASAPSSVTTVTGYVLNPHGWVVTEVGIYTSATVGANQAFAKFSS